MATKDLWGDLPTAEIIKTPSMILREQAAMLGEKTNNVLQGHVNIGRDGSEFTADFSIIARVLDNYTQKIVLVRYKIINYPLQIWNFLSATSNPTNCKNEDEFTAKLQLILSSEEVRKLIIGLLSQSKAEALVE